VSARREQLRNQLDHGLHALVLDVPEDPAEQQHVDR
jgi:hypothetical protein